MIMAVTRARPCPDRGPEGLGIPGIAGLIQRDSARAARPPDVPTERPTSGEHDVRRGEHPQTIARSIVSGVRHYRAKKVSSPQGRFRPFEELSAGILRPPWLWVWPGRLLRPQKPPA